MTNSIRRIWLLVELRGVDMYDLVVRIVEPSLFTGYDWRVSCVLTSRQPACRWHLLTTGITRRIIFFKSDCRLFFQR